VIEHELARAQPLLDRYGYAAVFLAIFAEGIGIPAPGQTLLIAAALLAARGEFAIGALLVVAAIASATGVLGGYAIGRYGGSRLLARFAGPRLDRLNGYFERFGGLVVILGRFVDGARQMSGIAAGAVEMRFLAVLAWDVAGAVVWTAFWGLGAYWLGRDMHQVAHLLELARPYLWIAALLLTVVAVIWLVRGRSLHARRGATG
jgi:membrane protein DedA with SNARE-associated domain